MELPGALDRKFPNAGREWGWQWVFPATRTYRHPETGQCRQHFFHESALQRLVCTTMIYTRVLNRSGPGVVSPVDIVAGSRAARPGSGAGLDREASQSNPGGAGLWDARSRLGNEGLPNPEAEYLLRIRPRGGRGRRD